MTTTTTLRSLLIAALAAIALVLGFLIASGSARAANPLPIAPSTNLPGVAGQGVTVVGTASATGTPDTLRLDMGVSVTKGSVAEAMSTANARMAAVQKALRDNGVGEKDLTSTALSVQPQYDYSANGGTPRLTGYSVTQGVVATIREVAQAGKVIEAATSAGGDTTVINGIGLDVDDPEGVLASARGKAIENARAKAAAYAEAAGVSVGQVLAITETSAPSKEMPMPYAARDLAVAGAAPAISPGTQEYAVTVTVTFALA